MSKSDFQFIMSVILVLAAFLWLLRWRINIDKELDESESKNETIEDSEKK